MPDCYMFWLKDSDTGCSPHSGFDGLNSCAVCERYPLPGIKDESHLYIACDAHSKLMTKDWILEHYPKMEDWFEFKTKNEF